MFEEIIKVRRERHDWAEKAVKHALKLTKEDLDLGCYDDELAAFREAMAAPHGPMVMVAAMDILAEVVLICLRSAYAPTDPVALIQLFPELSISIHYPYGEAMIDACIMASAPTLDAAFESHYQCIGGKTTLLIALAYVLRESPPSSWGRLEFERNPNRSADILHVTFKPSIDS